MHQFAAFLSSNYFCAICLKTPDKVRLVFIKNAEFFKAIQIPPETQWICTWCSARLRHFYELQNRAQRSQRFLASIRMGTIYQTNETYSRDELEQIRRERYQLKYITEIPTSHSLPIHIISTMNEIQSSPLKAVRIKPKERHTDKIFNESDIKHEEPVISFKDEPDFDTQESDATDKVNFEENSHSEIVYSCILNVEPQQFPSLNSEDAIDAETFESADPVDSKPKQQQARDILRAEMLRKEFNSGKKEITLSEADDIGHAAYDVVEKHVRKTRYTEEQLRRLHSEALQSTKYKDSKYKCEPCASGFATQPTYDRHMKKHSPSSGTFRCVVCETYHKTRSHISTHISSHYRAFTCTLCGNNSTALQHASNHYFIQHAGMRLKCAHCEKSFRSPSYLKKHFVVHEKVYGPLETSTCKICQKTYVTSTTKQKYRFTNHVRSHSEGKKSFYCTICDEEIVASRRSNHMKRHATWIACSVCQKMFAGQDTLNSHKDRIHAQAKKYQCDTCGKLFFCKSDIRIHIEWTHLKLGGVTCTTCGTRFRRQGELRTHVMNVHEKKPKPKNILCDVCGKGFSTPAIMKNHRLIHTGDKPHKCEHCGQMFRQKCAMRTHIQLKHMNVKWSELVANRKRRKQLAANIVE